MNLPPNKTRIVCTIGPASASQEVLKEMTGSGMNVAPLNFSHGAFEDHKRVIGSIRAAASEAGERVAILADPPGPKIRIGILANEPITLKPGSLFNPTAEETIGDERHVFVSFSKLAEVVKPGDILFLSDGLIQLEVVSADSGDFQCRVVAGGDLIPGRALNFLESTSASAPSRRATASVCFLRWRPVLTRSVNYSSKALVTSRPSERRRPHSATIPSSSPKSNVGGRSIILRRSSKPQTAS